MSKLFDSRSLEGGILPGQDFRPGIDVDVRSQILVVRIVGRREDGIVLDEDELRGDWQGLSVWEQVVDRRPNAAWREMRVCVVVGANGYTGSGRGDGSDEDGATFGGVEGGGGGVNLERGNGSGITFTGGQPVFGGGSIFPPVQLTGPVTGQPIPTQIKQSSLYNGYSP